MQQPGDNDGDEQTTLAAGTRLGKYQIVRLLGRGGMGAVYEAVHEEINKRVALKTLSPAVAAIPGARARFLREAQLTSRVRHPHIVDVTDMGTEGGYSFLVMELLRGEDLGQRLTRRGALPAAELVEIMLAVCSAVSSAHGEGVVHRDLKPQNIFLGEGPRGTHPTVLDFGISKGTDTAAVGVLTTTGAMVGTPYYLAPEQIQDARAAGPASDQYALGVILYECLTGQRPFEGDSLFLVFQAIVSGKTQPPRSLRPDIPADLEAVVSRAMRVDPKARFASTHELGCALLPFATPRTRMIWEGEFLSAGAEASAASPAAATPSPSKLASTTPLPPVRTPPPVATTPLPPLGAAGHVSAGGTRIYDGAEAPRTPARPAKRPPTPRPLDLDLEVPRKRGGAILIGALALGVVGAAGYFLIWPALAPRPPAVPHEAAREPTREAAPEPAAPKAATPPVRVVGPATYRVSVTVDPDTAAIDLDGTRVAMGHLERDLLLDHARHTLRLEAEGYVARTIEFRDAPPPDRVVLVQKTPPPRAAPPRPAAPETASRTRRAAPPRPAREREPRSAGKEEKEKDEAPRTLNPNGAPVIY